MQKLITYIGLDVHKETIAVVFADAGKRSKCAKKPVFAVVRTACSAQAAGANVVVPGAVIGVPEDLGSEVNVFRAEVRQSCRGDSPETDAM